MVRPSAAQSGRFAGYAGPAGRTAAETISKYIIVDMYGKAVQGIKAADAVSWATGELQKIYGAWAIDRLIPYAKNAGHLIENHLLQMPYVPK